jgi:hypothetical protein
MLMCITTNSWMLKRIHALTNDTEWKSVTYFPTATLFACVRACVQQLACCRSARKFQRVAVPQQTKHRKQSQTVARKKNYRDVFRNPLTISKFATQSAVQIPECNYCNANVADTATFEKDKAAVTTTKLPPYTETTKQIADHAVRRLLAPFRPLTSQNDNGGVCHGQRIKLMFRYPTVRDCVSHDVVRMTA